MVWFVSYLNELKVNVVPYGQKSCTGTWTWTNLNNMFRRSMQHRPKYEQQSDEKFYLFLC